MRVIHGVQVVMYIQGVDTTHSLVGLRLFTLCVTLTLWV